MSAALKKLRPPGRAPRSGKQLVRMTVEIPMLMRQAIRDREKLSNCSGADVLRGILLTALRLEMELIQRGRGAGLFKSVD